MAEICCRVVTDTCESLDGFMFKQKVFLEADEIGAYYEPCIYAYKDNTWYLVEVPFGTTGTQYDEFEKEIDVAVYNFETDEYEDVNCGGVSYVYNQIYKIYIQVDNNGVLNVSVHDDKGSEVLDCGVLTGVNYICQPLQSYEFNNILECSLPTLGEKVNYTHFAYKRIDGSWYECDYVFDKTTKCNKTSDLTIKEIGQQEYEAIIE